MRDGGVQYLALQKACRELAGRIRITTPDPYFNTLGGALAVAADGIWGKRACGCMELSAGVCR